MVFTMKASRKFLAPLFVLVLALAALAFTACNSGSEEEIDPAGVVSSVTLNQTSAFLSVSEGAENSVALTATLDLSEEGAEVDTTWSTSNGAVASVSGGTVTAVGNGVAVITATAGNKSATCVVAVTDTVVSDAAGLASAAAAAQNGAVIALSAGTYSGDVTFNAQNVSLVGAGASSVTVHGSVTFAGGGSCFLSGMTVTAEGRESAVSVSGAGASLELRHASLGGAVYGAKLALSSESGGDGNTLRVYDSSFTDVWCALYADSVGALLRTSFTGVTYQYGSAGGYCPAFGDAAETGVSVPSAGEQTDAA